MAKIIGLQFRNASKIYYFNSGRYVIKPGTAVIVETVQGVELGVVAIGTKEIPDEQIPQPLKEIIRIATPQDLEQDKTNRQKEKETFAEAEKKIQQHGLDMKLVRVEYTFDRAKITFYFTSDGRVDFRELVKDLAATYKTRIELRQIGARDEAKLLGGLGPCGQPCCCNTFLHDFQPVSIKMAKEQGLALNPTKISGLCGRLMCCLKYEQHHYEQTRKIMPRINATVQTPDGQGTVFELNMLRETVKVKLVKGDNVDVREYHATKVKSTDTKHPTPEPVEPADIADLSDDDILSE